MSVKDAISQGWRAMGRLLIAPINWYYTLEGAVKLNTRPNPPDDRKRVWPYKNIASRKEPSTQAFEAAPSNTPNLLLFKFSVELILMIIKQAVTVRIPGGGLMVSFVAGNTGRFSDIGMGCEVEFKVTAALKLTHPHLYNIITDKKNVSRFIHNHALFAENDFQFVEIGNYTQIAHPLMDSPNIEMRYGYNPCIIKFFEEILPCQRQAIKSVWVHIDILEFADFLDLLCMLPGDTKLQHLSIRIFAHAAAMRRPVTKTDVIELLRTSARNLYGPVPGFVAVFSPGYALMRVVSFKAMTVEAILVQNQIPSQSNDPGGEVVISKEEIMEILRFEEEAWASLYLPLF